MTEESKLPGRRRHRLTQQEDRFAAEIIKTGKRALAYRLAYNVSKDADAQGVTNNACMIMRKPRVAARIEHYRKIAEATLEVSVERVAQELARIAFFDPRDLFDADGQPIPISDLPEDAARVIAGLDVKKTGQILNYKLASKQSALETLAKWKKMLVERVEAGKPGAFDDDMAALEKRIKERSVRLGLAKVLVPEKGEDKTLQ